ncbi:hypothetical protein O3G_MSEX011244 [Manduca sexta]|uniref:Uncharacterized protein n=1 Tax=Manduca sexta TaxID=7130 RepID=A0A922CVA5_MANSE|nr:hypothetical protein O3G_MSEX011244 [Manduca sexta]
MDNVNMKNWVSHPEVCRCCLSATGTWDVTASYISESGMKEVYFEMLQECYGLTLSRVMEWGPSRLVCGQCVRHLRDACSFKKQVLLAESLFTDYCANKDNLHTQSVKIEKETIELYNTEPVSFTCNADVINDGENKVKGKPNVNLGKTGKDEIICTKRQRSLIKEKRKRKIIDSDNDIDSDTPIAALTRKNNIESNEIVAKDLGHRTENKTEGILHTPQNGVKQVSERRRLMVTCEAVLRGSTACPFRHHRSWFQCFYCTQDFMDITQLRQHTAATHADLDDELKKIKRFPRSLQIEITNLQCRHCGINLTDVESMRRHFVEAHEKIIYNECIADYKVDVSPYSCHLCGRQFHVFRTLTTHLNEHYANCICDVCGKSFLNSKRLKVHKRTHEHGNYPCAECGKVLKTKISKANHMESAHSRRVMKCQICSKPMKHYNERVKHMSEAHDITHRFKCPMCPREYNIKHYLATHMRQTHGHRNKKCEECGMAFITNHGLKKHMLRHSGAKPHACALCRKSYARSHTLREHMRAHHSHPADPTNALYDTRVT